MQAYQKATLRHVTNADFLTNPNLKGLFKKLGKSRKRLSRRELGSVGYTKNVKYIQKVERYISNTLSGGGVLT